ncbi:MAG TPA: thiamine pyrophosphate-binding protein, partial [Prevotella sp.]
MYSDKDNINILTALLVEHGVTTAVVCPGSRNAPIVHNLNECPAINCYGVTDERSAGFYALGMAQLLDKPVAVCVTSGTALLNLLPAVAEAYYQHQPLVVISADRPAAWIGQLDGQTLPQNDALGHFVRKAVALPEPHTEEETWLCNRLVNEALLAATQRGGSPVHINVPIGKPLFEFHTPQLPPQRVIRRMEATAHADAIAPVARAFWQASRPMVVIGQQKKAAADACCKALTVLQSAVPVLYECLGMPSHSLSGVHVEGALDSIETEKEPYQP